MTPKNFNCEWNCKGKEYPLRCFWKWILNSAVHWMWDKYCAHGRKPWSPEVVHQAAPWPLWTSLSASAVGFAPDWVCLPAVFVYSRKRDEKLFPTCLCPLCAISRHTGLMSSQITSQVLPLAWAAARCLHTLFFFCLFASCFFISTTFFLHPWHLEQ